MIVLWQLIFQELTLSWDIFGTFILKVFTFKSFIEVTSFSYGLFKFWSNLDFGMIIDTPQTTCWTICLQCWNGILLKTQGIMIMNDELLNILNNFQIKYFITRPIDEKVSNIHIRFVSSITIICNFLFNLLILFK